MKKMMKKRPWTVHLHRHCGRGAETMPWTLYIYTDIVAVALTTSIYTDTVAAALTKKNSHSITRSHCGRGADEEE